MDYGQINYPARTPTSLVTDQDQFSYYGLGNYERLRHYGAVDNYNYRYRYARTPVNEAYTIGSNGCNIAETQTASSTLNSNGAFEDRYTTRGQSIPQCSVDPWCVTDSTQTLWVDSQPFYKSVVWSCSNVSVSP